MNDIEISSEAQKRIANMSKEEKEARISSIRDEETLINYISSYGKKGLSNEEKKKFKSIVKDRNEKLIAIGSDKPKIESEVFEKFKISRDDIKNMAKNPYKALVFRDILMSLVLNAGLVVAGINGWRIFLPVIASLSSILANATLGNVISYIKYKKMQKKYTSDEFEEKEIEAKVFDQLYDEYEQEYGQGGMIKC